MFLLFYNFFLLFSQTRTLRVGMNTTGATSFLSITFAHIASTVSNAATPARTGDEKTKKDIYKGYLFLFKNCVVQLISNVGGGTEFIRVLTCTAVHRSAEYVANQLTALPVSCDVSRWISSTQILASHQLHG